MALNVSQTVSEITAALDALNRDTGTEAQRWTAVINVLYTRIKADLVVTGDVTASGSDPQGGTQNVSGTSVAGGGSGSIA